MTKMIHLIMMIELLSSPSSSSRNTFISAFDLSQTHTRPLIHLFRFHFQLIYEQSKANDRQQQTFLFITDFLRELPVNVSLHGLILMPPEKKKKRNI